MKNALGKLIITVSLAAVIALAIPAGFMTASVVRGESPRQLTEEEQQSDQADDALLQDEPTEPEPQQAEDDLSQKPEVLPDPGPPARVNQEPETQGEADPEPTPEPEPEPAPQPKPKAKAKISAKSTAVAETVSVNNPSQDKPAEKEEQPVAKTEEPAQPENALPKAVLGPNEAPCLLDGLDGYSYDYGLTDQAVATPQQQTAQSYQEAPPLLDGLDGYYYDTGNDGNGNSGDGRGNADNFNTYNNEEQQKTDAKYVLNTRTLKIHFPSCDDVKKIAPQNYATSNAEESELLSQGYTTCGHCH